MTKSIYPFLETIKVENFRAYNLEYHQNRLDKTIYGNFGVKSNIILKDLITPPTKNLYRCRVVYDKNLINVEYIPYTMRKIESFKIVESNIEYRYKSTNRDEINQLLLQKQNNDDIIITQNESLKDTSIANIALYIDNIWFTPTNPLLKGTMRAKLIKEKKIFERELRVDDLKIASKFAIMNAMIGFYEIQRGVIVIIQN